MGWARWAWLMQALAFLAMDPNAPKRTSSVMSVSPCIFESPISIDNTYSPSESTCKPSVSTYEPSVSTYETSESTCKPSVSTYETSVSIYETSVSTYETSPRSNPTSESTSATISLDKMTSVHMLSSASGLNPLTSPESICLFTSSSIAQNVKTTLSDTPKSLQEQSTFLPNATTKLSSSYYLHVTSTAVLPTVSGPFPTAGETGMSAAAPQPDATTLLATTLTTAPSTQTTPINMPTLTPLATFPSNPTSNTGRLKTWQTALVGVGSALGLALVMFIIIIGICWVANRKKRYSSKRDPQPSLLADMSENPKDFWSIDPNELGDLPAIGRRRNMVEIIRRASTRKTQSKVVTLAELENLVSDQKALEVEFASIPKHTTSRTDVPLGAENKNRYLDVVPNPHTRVGLFLKFGVSNSDYINANYIQGHDNNPKAYIATQGPLPWTVGDFWRMVWEQKSSIIIMAADLRENGTPKCAQYWPDEKITLIARYDDFEVRLNKKHSSDNYTTRSLQLKHLEKGGCRNILHFWFSSWPDHGVLHSSLPLIKLLQEVKGISRDISGPVVVHCSAGVGRTGVIIGVDIGMRHLEEEGKVDVLRIVSSMRLDRGEMVQTLGQYVFIHETLLEYRRQLEKQRGNQSRPLELCESAV